MREQVLKTSIEALKTSHQNIVVTEEKRAANTKGKLKATEQDEEREAKIKRQLVQLQSAESELRKELEQSTPDEEVDLAGQSKSGRPPSYASSDQHPALTAAMPAFRDGEPIYNPFTGSYAYRETGFEPGPSEPNRASKGQQDAWILDNRSEDDIDDGGKATANFPDGAKAETSPGQLSEDEATATRHGSDIATRGVKSEDGDADRVGKRRFGNIVKLFDSWTTFTVQRLFFGEKHSASESSASYTEEEKEDGRNQQRQDNEWNLCWQHERQLEQSSSQKMDSVLSPEEENLAKRDQTDVSRKLSIELQTQQDEGETRRHAAFVIEQDRMEAMRLQKTFELEDERERQALEFVRGLEEAVRLEEQEAILQAQRQVAISFAQDLEEAERLNQEFRALEEVKQADREYAERLSNELRMQNDRTSAQGFEADIENQTAFEHPVSSPLDEPLIPGSWNTQQTPGTVTNRPRSPLIPASGQPTKQNMPPMSFQEFQSFRGEQRPTPNSVRQDFPSDPNSSRSQETWIQALKDRLYAQKLFEAEKTRLAKEEDQQRKDFKAWQKASEAADRPHNNAGILAAEQETVRNTEKTERVRVEKGRAPGSGSAQAAPQLRTVHAAQVASAIDSADCVICRDSLPKTQLVRPCDHYYCRACLADWFQRVLREKPKKRPRCCKRDLPVNLVAHQLGPVFSQAYRMFELELMTPNPLYCSSRKCAAFVPPSNIHGDVGLCRCGGRTCRHCRSQEHRDKLCAQDKETQKVEELGKRKGWKHCPKCQHMIERTAGCLHMTCSQCRTEFCWKCLETSCRGEGSCRPKN